MMNRYNFLRILAIAAGFGLVAWWTIFDEAARVTVNGIGLGALACAGVCGCWVLIRIAERRARMRRFMRNEPNASERRWMERERQRHGPPGPIPSPRPRPPMDVDAPMPTVKAPSPFGQGDVILGSGDDAVTRAMHTIDRAMRGTSADDRMAVSVRLSRLAKVLELEAEALRGGKGEPPDNDRAPR